MKWLINFLRKLFGTGVATKQNPTKNKTAEDTSDVPSPVPNQFADEIPAEEIKFLDADVYGWAKMYELGAVKRQGDVITLPQDGTRVWKPTYTGSNGKEVSGNLWLVAQLSDGKWYAKTCDWMGVGQREKTVRCLNNDHLKHPLFEGFEMEAGKDYGFFVSGFARGGKRNVQERTNIKKITWD